MPRCSKRRYLLLSVLGVAGAALLADRLGSRPESAAARPTSDEATAVAAGWQDVGDAIERWTQDAYTPLGPGFAAGERDLFVPTDAFAAIAARRAVPQAEIEHQRTLAQREAEFRARHTLTGTLLGKVPAAVVDGALLHINSDVDGYRVAEIHRDCVVFQACDNAHRIRMDVDSRPITP